MQEIEIKFEVKDLKKLESQLLDLGCTFSKELKQKDVVFIPDLKDTSSSEGKMFIRIRNTNGKVELTLKKRSKRVSQSKEIEFEVSDMDSAYDFLDTLGLKEWVTIEKRRITTKYKDFDICIDEVKRLGSFVEIETITSDENKTEYYEEKIISLAKELNIDINNRIESHYDTMMSELNKNE